MSNIVVPALLVLSDDVINKIAAGEVIERPASIIRELVDNAIDAGATSILVEVKEGGQSYIKVVDNGVGMSAADAELSFKRHATSKIKNVADLEQISSLGFRGEALSSIAAVAEVRLKTKQESSELGTELVLFEGKIVSKKSCALQVGTEFEVTKLFANLPARRKFLKTARTDLAKIQEWLYQSALANPNVRYKLVADGKDIFRLSEHKDIFARLESLLSGSSIRIDFKAGPFSVRGMVAHPSQADFKAGAFIFLVNGRPIQDRMLMRALRDAWSTGIRSAENPIGTLEITLPPSEVDVNVHPQKSEVRFRNSQAVFGSLYKAVKLGLSEWKPQLFSSSVQQPNFDAAISSNNALDILPINSELSEFSALASKNLSFEPMLAEAVSTENLNINNERYIGQILGVFLLFESSNKTFLVDAHAAHERIRFNELLGWAKSKNSQSQRLLVPEKIDLLEKEIAYLCEKEVELAGYGLHFCAGDKAIFVNEMPSSLNFRELPNFLKSLAELEMQDIGSAIQKAIEKSLARSACRSSVMSGDKLLPEQAQKLWQQIKNEPHGAVCPHGRPVMVELLRADIDKMFFRDGF